MITLHEALLRLLRDRAQAVITDCGLFLLIHELFARKSYEGERINIRRARPDLADLRRAREALARSSLLTPDHDLPLDAHRVSIVPDEPAEHVVCEVDPLAYVSHLSAMQRHGITNRNPVEVSLARPGQGHWRGLLLAELTRALGEAEPGFDARRLLKRVRFPDRIRNRRVVVHDMSEPGAWVAVRGTPVRVATVGQTFLDTLAHPAWCGDMAHVLEVWEEHAATFLEEIIAALDGSPRQIAKVRAGYILQERLGFVDERIEAWTRFAQRGGSQVLDPSKAYTPGKKPVFSEKWMIALNA
jgi:predicted transcriptional regulator of viral defense system